MHEPLTNDNKYAAGHVAAHTMTPTDVSELACCQHMTFHCDDAILTRREYCTQRTAKQPKVQISALNVDVKIWLSVIV